MNILLAIDFALPFTNPVLKFFILLLIILTTPILFNRLKIPSLIGLIIVGAILGTHGLNLLERDSSITLFGTVGLLYIMFLAGLEIDMAEFKKNSQRSFVFGMLTFLIPMLLGTFIGYYLLKLSFISSVLLASMFASHTLIAYPIVSKLGAAKNRAVTVTIGGTMITDTLALLVLAVIVGMHKGGVTTVFWIRLVLSVLLFGFSVMLLFPLIARWFFKHFQDNVSQYIFVLMMVFLGALLAEIAGVEGIIGAFLGGLALNRFIPHTSPLMNRVGFVGNALFIPFFLLSVGMLIDYRTFITDWETIKVAIVMTIIAISSKYLAALFTQKLFKYSKPERQLIFGLSNAQAAATLAAIMVGYQVGLLNDAILNGTIVMILVTCTIATIEAQKGAFAVSLMEGDLEIENEGANEERILIPLGNPDTLEELMGLSLIIKSLTNTENLYALNIIKSGGNSTESEKKGHKLLDEAAKIAASTDTYLHKIFRYDENILNGIAGVTRKYNITDIVMGLHVKSTLSESFLGELTEGILHKTNATTLIYKATQPLSTIRKYIVIIPPNAEKEIGFPFWLSKIWHIGQNTGARIIFHASDSTLDIIKHIHSKHPIDAIFEEFEGWNGFVTHPIAVKKDDLLFIVMSRSDKRLYNKDLMRVPEYINTYFKDNSFILLHPMQASMLESRDNLMNPALLSSVERLGDVGKTLWELIKEK